MKMTNLMFSSSKSGCYQNEWNPSDISERSDVSHVLVRVVSEQATLRHTGSGGWRGGRLCGDGGLFLWRVNGLIQRKIEHETNVYLNVIFGKSTFVY